MRDLKYRKTARKRNTTRHGINAERVKVKLGRSSVNTIEVLSGLKIGDQVILSDMSAYDAYDRIRLK